MCQSSQVAAGMYLLYLPPASMAWVRGFVHCRGYQWIPVDWFQMHQEAQRSETAPVSRRGLCTLPFSGHPRIPCKTHFLNNRHQYQTAEEPMHGVPTNPVNPVIQ